MAISPSVVDTADADVMEGLEVAILARLGVPDPYRIRAAKAAS